MGAWLCFCSRWRCPPVVETLPDRLGLVHLVVPLPGPPASSASPGQGGGKRSRPRESSAFSLQSLSRSWLNSEIHRRAGHAPGQLTRVSWGGSRAVSGGVPGGIAAGIPAIELLLSAGERGCAKPPAPPAPQRIQVSADMEEAKLLQMIPPIIRRSPNWPVCTVRLSAIIRR